MKKIILTFALICSMIGVSAQSSTLYSAYFLDGMVNRHELNASSMPVNGYFGLPVVNGITFTLGTNMGIGTWIYPSSDPDVLNTFLHPDVSADDFEKNLGKFSNVDFQFDTKFLTFGFYGWGGFNTFDFSLHAEGNVAIASDLFRFVKYGQSSNSTTYDLSGTSVNVTSYAEFALGHARKINDKLTLGVKLKYLAGIANASVGFDTFDINLSEDQWKINSAASGNISFAGSEVDLSEDADELFTFDSSKAGLAGMGFAIDLGVTYDVLDWLRVSASVNDLGYIKWTNGNSSIETDKGEFVFGGFSDVDLEDFDVDAQVEKLGDDLEALLNYNTSTNAGAYKQMLTTDINVGAEFLTRNHKFSAGLLYTAHFLNTFTTHKGMVAGNIKFNKWLNMAVTYSLSNYGYNYGFVFNLCPKGFNVFVGTDYGVPTTTSEFIPVEDSFGLSISAGLNFTFGKTYEKHLAKRAERKSKRDE